MVESVKTKRDKRILGVVILAALSLVSFIGMAAAASGMFEDGADNGANTVLVGKYEVTSMAPIISLNEQRGPPLAQWPTHVWYGSDMESVSPDTLILGFKVIDSSDLIGMDISVKQSGAEVAYAKNFSLSYVPEIDRMVLYAEHDGFRSIVLEDVNGTSMDDDWANKPTVIPEFYEDKPFIIALVMKTNQAGTYTKEVIQNGNKIIVTSNYPIVDDYVGLAIDHNIKTWYFSGYNTTNNFCEVQAKVINPATDLDNMDISVRFPNGKVSYAKNFKVTPVNGGWLLDAEHYGFDLLYITTDTEHKGIIWENGPVLLPDYIQGKSFNIELGTTDEVNPTIIP